AQTHHRVKHVDAVAVTSEKDEPRVGEQPGPRDQGYDQCPAEYERKEAVAERLHRHPERVEPVLQVTTPERPTPARPMVITAGRSRPVRPRELRAASAMAAPTA